MSLTNMIERFGQTFSIDRDGVCLGEARGIYDASKDIVSFKPDTDVKPGDKISSDFGESYVIIKVQTLTERGRPHHKEAKCKDQNEIELAQTSTVFNIGTVSNSVIGSGNYVSVSIENLKSQVAEKGGEDEETLTEIVELLNKILNNQVPIKKGMFSKFSEVLERHSWLSGSMASAIIGFLMQRIQ